MLALYSVRGGFIFIFYEDGSDIFKTRFALAFESIKRDVASEERLPAFIVV